MANSTRVLLALVIGIGVGWLVGCSLAQPKVKLEPGDHLIKVGPKASDLDDDPAEISLKMDHKVRWVALDAMSTLTITFDSRDFPRAADGEPPFAGPLVIKCNPNNFCPSGSINPKLKDKLKPGQKLYYKYGQTLKDKDGKEDVADGMIIIEP